MSIGNHIHKFIDFEIREGDSSFIHLKLVFTYGLRFVSGGFFRNDTFFLPPIPKNVIVIPNEAIVYQLTNNRNRKAK